jgi:hypothetical protein
MGAEVLRWSVYQLPYIVEILTSPPDTEVQAHITAARTQGQVLVNGSQHNEAVNSEPSAISSSDLPQNIAQESMYLRVLRSKERVWGPEHPTTLETVIEVGSLYTDAGRRSEAEQMFSRALLGFQKVEAGKTDNRRTQEVLRKLDYVRELD